MSDYAVKCKYCNDYEYYGEMRWLSGKCMCRDCYKKEYQYINGTKYQWDDLDGLRPSEQEIKEVQDD